MFPTKKDMTSSSFEEVWTNMMRECVARFVPHLASELQRAGHDVSESDLLTILNLSASALKNEPLQQQMTQRLPSMFSQAPSAVANGTSGRSKKTSVSDRPPCQAMTKTGNQCTHKAKEGSIYCGQHSKSGAAAAAAPLSRSSFMNAAPLVARPPPDTSRFRPHPDNSSLMVDTHGFVLNGDVVVARQENGTDRQLTDQEKAQARQIGYKLSGPTMQAVQVPPPATTGSGFSGFSLNKVPGLRPIGVSRASDVSLPIRPPAQPRQVSEPDVEEAGGDEDLD